jgi:hypothetical protein
VSQRSQGLSGEQIMVRLDEVLRHVGRPTGPVEEDAEGDDREFSGIRLTPAITSDLAPILKAVPELMEQLTAATDRAARAETKLDFMVEQVATLKDELKEVRERGPAVASSTPPPPPAQAAPPVPPEAEPSTAPEQPLHQSEPEPPAAPKQEPPSEPEPEMELEPEPWALEEERDAWTPSVEPDLSADVELEELGPDVSQDPPQAPPPRISWDPPSEDVSAGAEERGSVLHASEAIATENVPVAEPNLSEASAEVTPEDLFNDFLQRISQKGIVQTSSSPDTGTRPDEQFRKGFERAVAKLEAKQDPERLSPEERTQAIWGSAQEDWTGDGGPVPEPVPLPYSGEGGTPVRKRRWWERRR